MNGWEIACPDGKHRHFPYINQDDAEFDAKLYSETGKPCVCDEVFLLQHGPCPGGGHTAQPVVFSMPPERGES